ncbi:glycoside hydrolase family 64 protein [Aplosporella prunicola CBS 121167]|uniref:Glycoside hydrolase family 64 protein n=1 Tax=Aplosporella prunicola CBS 121167 TaxID=1176127 RepID=A0A6A6B6T6_9PEZI|nr:glycoside hydrolase family 64 protein [Aplosporella prunicola CBS 121167]KAF2139852.1 glycoside hydrolase family 64 protein [Aplosporella prunicola CBS 121167]
MPFSELIGKILHLRRSRSTTTPATKEAPAAPARVSAGPTGAQRRAISAQAPLRAAETTLDFELVNNTTSSTVYAYITGQALDNNSALFLLQADGQTAYYPSSPSSVGSALSADCAIPLGAPGSSKKVTIPHLAGARIWFAVDAPLTFLLNPGPALVEPAVTNPSDPNIDTTWGFAEFTWNSAQLYANITYVDFFCLPIALTLTNAAGSTQHVAGSDANGLATVCQGLEAQSAADGAPWSSLIVKNSSGGYLRALSPNDGIVTNSALFQDYYARYVDSVWAHYAAATLSVDTQASYGTLSGRVDGDALVVGNERFARPSAADIFSCSTGPFANASGSAERNAIIPRLAAAFNRSTLLKEEVTPAETSASYYKEEVTNHYSRIVHEANLDARGYAFPYDDVAPNGGGDQSGSVFDGAPVLLRVAVGGNGASA